MNHLAVYVIDWKFPSEFSNSEKYDFDFLIRDGASSRHRKECGHSDAFLFLISRDQSKDLVARFLSDCGFCNITVFCVDSDGPAFPWEAEDDIDLNITSWLDIEHPAALCLPVTEPSPYAGAWWHGVEAEDADWGINAKNLPATYWNKAETWVEILTQDEEFDTEKWMDQQEVSLQFATLCEWLHGFEQVVENGYNTFVADTDLQGIGVSEVYLGVMAGKDQDGSLIQECLELEIEDDAEFLRTVLTRVLESKRDDVVSRCTDFFGSESQLLFVLWQSIWPNYRVPSREAFEELVGGNLLFGDDESYLRLRGFEFVQDGWSEYAYPQ